MQELEVSDVYSISWRMFSNYLHDMYCISACLKIFMRGSQPLVLKETSFSQSPDLLNTYYRIANDSYESRFLYYSEQIDKLLQLSYQNITIDLNGYIIHNSKSYPLNRVKIYGQYLVANTYLSLIPAVSIHMQHDPDIIANICNDPKIMLDTVCKTDKS